MGRRRVQRLQEQFRQQGFVEFGINPVKVLIHLVGYLLIGAGLVLVAWGFGPVGIGLAGILVLGLWAGMGWVFGEQAFGTGPALRFDRSGITLRRRGGPVTSLWSDWTSVSITSRNALGWFPQVQVSLTGEAWAAYRKRSRSHPWLEKVFRSDPQGTVTLFSILDASAKDVVAVVDAEFLEEIGADAPRQRDLQDLVASPEDPEARPSEKFERIKEDALLLGSRRTELEEQARKEGRELTPGEVAELDAIERRIVAAYETDEP